MNQNFNELNLSRDELNVNSRTVLINSNRSKTGNKNSTLKVTHVDISGGVTQSHKLEHQQNVDLSLMGHVLRDSKVSSNENPMLLSVHPTHYHNNNHDSNSPVSSCISPSTSIPLTTSKSENNIFDKNMSVNSSQFNVVSLSDLSDDAQYVNADDNGVHPWNDLSKMRVLNQWDENEQKDGNDIVNRF